MRRKTGLWTRIADRVNRFRGKTVERDLGAYARELERIDALARELDLQAASDRGLVSRAAELRRRARSGQSPDTLLPETYALAREAAARSLDLRLFEVQMIAALALHRGRLVEMQTGEGKTLAAVLPACLNALSGRGVHVLTFNDYLASRDAAWMRPVYARLGLEVASISEGMDAAARRSAYRADVTYLTAKEAGYDFLRESIVRHPQDAILRPRHFAIVDEADSILIDSARVPMVIAGCDDVPGDAQRTRLARLAGSLRPGEHFETDENRRNVYLTEAGAEEAERLLGSGDLHAPQNLGLLTRLNQALHARVLLERDVDYIVRDGRVEQVDEFTGRVHRDRHWPDGLQRAVEAKEGLCLADQGRVLNSITTQHFMRLYPKLSGMTGTALPADREFAEFYDLHTAIIPPNRPCIREDRPDVLFADLETKHAAVEREVRAARARGQPVLIGTSSVQESERLARRLRAAGIDCAVLNAANDEAEAAIVSEAGAPGAVTVSTNMAGRGTDIRLGGSDERSRERVVESGGLYVIGTNRHESRRIDRQLRGRAGRQGDPGVSRFFISLADPLMQRFGIGELIAPRRASRIEPGRPIQDPAVHRNVARVQNIIEGQNMDIRRTLWSYSAYAEEKRRAQHEARSRVLAAGEPGLLAGSRPDLHAALLAELGAVALAERERQIGLHFLDLGWSSFLAHLADIRESAYLNVVGSRDPLQIYLEHAAAAFEDMQAYVETSVAESLEAARASGPELDPNELRGPASTWTYLINDNPFEWQLSIASPRQIGAGAWAAVLAALFWFVPVGYKLGSLLRRGWRKRKSE
ncbi:MAG: accessory Sec system translocase SecA2 [Deltaproteobacteria bacterium]|nr:accessory Sec system translocase SecA2 [Deltaproteobacteria bacterium]